MCLHQEQCLFAHCQCDGIAVSVTCTHRCSGDFSSAKVTKYNMALPGLPSKVIPWHCITYCSTPTSVCVGDAHTDAYIHMYTAPSIAITLSTSLSIYIYTYKIFRSIYLITRPHIYIYGYACLPGHGSAHGEHYGGRAIHCQRPWDVRQDLVRPRPRLRRGLHDLAGPLHSRCPLPAVHLWCSLMQCGISQPHVATLGV